MPENDGCDATAPLCAAIARGDERAFHAFYELWFPRLYAKARAITRKDESFCLDIVQDVMLKVATKIKALRSEDAVACWLAKVLVTTAIDRMRGERRRLQHELEAGLARMGEPAECDGLEEAQERLAWLSARLAELPAEDHALLLARFADGGTLELIGEDHGISGNAVAGRIRRALQRIKGRARTWLGGRNA